MMVPNILPGLIILALSPLGTQAASPPKNAILLSDVQSLTLRGNGAQTSHRRVSAIPQLKCVSSKGICNLFDIDVMRCTNQGSSYGDEDIEWSCTASLPEELKLGRTEVICEGYSSPNDPYVLKGSCGVEYRLSLTKQGERRHPDLAGGGQWFSDGQGFDGSAVLFFVIFIGVLAWIVYSACYATTNPNQRRPTRRSGGGGGGGGGGWNPGWGPDNNDAPPPYPGTKPSSQQGWQPGFWSGMAGGAAAGYLAGNRDRDRDDPFRRGYGGTSGWGSGGISGSSSSSNSQRHESTGFGSTSRR